MNEMAEKLNRCWELRKGPQIPEKATFAEEWTSINNFLKCFPEAGQFWPWKNSSGEELQLEIPLAISQRTEYRTFLHHWNNYVQQQLSVPMASPVQLFFCGISGSSEAFFFETLGELLELTVDVADQEGLAVDVADQKGLPRKVSFEEHGQELWVSFRPESPVVCIGCGE